MFTSKRSNEGRSVEPAMLTVHFSGESVTEHSMSVADLAPALVGLSDAIARYKELADPFLDLDVRITATRAGSFEVALQLLGTVANLAQTIDPSSASDIIAGLLDVIRIFNARQQGTGSVEPGDHEVVRQGDTYVDLEIGQFRFRAGRKAYRASRDGQLANSLGAASKPATMNGYDPVRFIQPEAQRSETIDSDTSTAMQELTLSEQPLDPSIEETTLQIDTIQARSNKWKFQKGGESFWCEIQDERFLNRWRNRQVAFINGDLLKVRLETEQYTRDGRLETGKRRILQVIEHIPLETQPAFDI